MENKIYLIYFFLVLYIIFYIIFYIINYKNLKSKKKDVRELDDLVKRFKIDKNKVNYKNEILYVSLINSFIVSSVGTFVTYLDVANVFKLAIGFVLLLALTYSLYEIYGRILKRKVDKYE